jgi:hypothetical protein
MRRKDERRGERGRKGKRNEPSFDFVEFVPVALALAVLPLPAALVVVTLTLTGLSRASVRKVISGNLTERAGVTTSSSCCCC